MPQQLPAKPCPPPLWERTEILRSLEVPRQEGGKQGLWPLCHPPPNCNCPDRLNTSCSRAVAAWAPAGLALGRSSLGRSLQATGRREAVPGARQDYPQGTEATEGTAHPEGLTEC